MGMTDIGSVTFWSMTVLNFVLSALSITNLGLISSMVGFILRQKHEVHTYQVSWPNNVVQLAVLPENLWTDQGHESNGVAGYGFFLGLIGMYVAWQQRSRKGKVPSKALIALIVLQSLAVLFTLSAIIFVFIVTNQTDNQFIAESIAKSGTPYPEHSWTPENWFKAVLELPLASGQHRHDIGSAVTHMTAWKWMLVPIFLVDILALGASVIALLREKEMKKYTECSAVEEVGPGKV